MKRLKLNPFLGYAIAFSIIGFAAAFTRALPHQDRKITITVSIQEADIILKALSELPLKESGNLYFNIQQQAQSQLQVQQRPVQKDSTTKKKP